MANIEKAIKLHGTDIEALPEGYDRVYIGGEACGETLFDWEKYTGLARALLRQGKSVSYVTPYLTVRREKFLDALFRELEGLAEDYGRLELVANDFGTIMRSRGCSIDVSLGRLLCRQDSDPRIPSFFLPQMQKPGYVKPPDNMAKHLRTQSLSKVSVDFLKNINHRIIRKETDNLLQGVVIDPDCGLQVALHVKGILVTVKHSEESSPGGEIHWDDPSITVNLYKKDNCLCYDNIRVSAAGYDRIVD